MFHKSCVTLNPVEPILSKLISKIFVLQNTVSNIIEKISQMIYTKEYITYEDDKIYISVYSISIMLLISISDIFLVYFE